MSHVINAFAHLQREIDTGTGALPFSATFHPRDSLLSELASSIEDGTGDGWVANGATAISASATAFRGDYGLAIESQDSDNTVQVISVPFTVNQFHTYVVSGYIRPDSVAREAAIQLLFYDADDVMLGESDTVNFTETVGSWVRLVGSAQAMATATHARVRVMVFDCGNTEVHYLDNVFVHRTSWSSYYSANLMLSGDFRMSDALRSCTSSIKATATGNSIGFNSAGGTAGAQVIAGQNYRLTAYLRANPVGIDSVDFGITWFDSNGDWLDYVYETHPVWADDWQLLSILVTAPPGAAYASVVIETYDTVSPGDSLYLGDIVLAVHDLHFDEGDALWGVWRWIPEYLKHSDERITEPVKPFQRYVEASISPLHDLVDLIERFYYEAPDVEGADPNSTCDLVNPWTADTEWLLWLSRLVGIRIANVALTFGNTWQSITQDLGDGQSPLTWSEIDSADQDADGAEWGEILGDTGDFDLSGFLRQQIATALTGQRAGSYSSIIEAAKSMLIGNKEVEITRNYLNSPWRVRIRTHTHETPSADALMVLVNGLKPAGVTFTHAHFTDEDPSEYAGLPYDAPFPYDEGTGYDN